MAVREVIFRGQTRRKGEKVRLDGTPADSNWVYGGVSQDKSIIYQIEPTIDKFPVYPDTVGQYTGLKDMNGNMIFEDDIVVYRGEAHKVVYMDKYMRFACVKPNTVFSVFSTEKCEIAGNIHDNPELLEVKK